MQQIAVLLIVAACTAYAAWALMPMAWRRGLARRLLRRELAAPVAGCGGCGGGCGPARSAAPQARPITLHRRPPGG